MSESTTTTTRYARYARYYHHTHTLCLSRRVLILSRSGGLGLVSHWHGVRSLARTFLYCAVWCDDDDDDEAGAHTYTSVSAHYCQLLATTNESSSRRCAPFGLRVRSIRRPVTIFVLLLLLLLLRAVRVDEADNDSVHVPCALCCVRTM